ncbi:hypothetical protein FACS1894125_3450 [Actinomycetota bacterium]|nr:hypothetical protein FACS1894125_3450 [Actinomycetota bacterium]
MNNIDKPRRCFLYARKSTDTDDMQVQSIDAQLVELRVYAKQNNITIVDELIERRTAKIPGRPIFNAMLDRIEAGEVDGILAWHPDRLARNSVDGLLTGRKGHPLVTCSFFILEVLVLRLTPSTIYNYSIITSGQFQTGPALQLYSANLRTPAPKPACHYDRLKSCRNNRTSRNLPKLS